MYGIYMKKMNNKYRSCCSTNSSNNNNNNSSNNTIYSLNYKFDSNSIAGKVNGTALDLIKRYNDYAKDAQSNNDYVNAEIFRQYAEHYRKIVTEINERKNQRINENGDNREERFSGNRNDTNNTESVVRENQTETANAPRVNNENTPVVERKQQPVENVTPAPKPEFKKSFKIIEISHAKADEAVAETVAAVAADEATPAAPKRVYRRRVAASS